MKTAVLYVFAAVLIIGFAFATAEDCQEGETKMESCNICRCLQGNWACTRKECISKREAIAAGFNREKRDMHVAEDLKTTPCAPRDYFTIDCNVCYCNTDSTGYLCTDNNCANTRNATVDSTTTQIPLGRNATLILSKYGVRIVDGQVDNELSRVGKSVAQATIDGADEATTTGRD